MKNVLLLAVLFCLSTTLLFSQSVGISSDGSNPDTSAMLDVKSSSKGMLIPRMAQAQRNAIVLPATGLMIFQTDNTPGFYYYTGTSWTAITPNNFWYLNGNAGTTGSNFIGTTDNQPLNFKINNQFAGRITTRSTALGLSALSFSSGVDNTAIGNSALLFNSSGNGNVANGTDALRSNTTGFNNTASGFQSMVFNQAGAFNTAMGSVSLAANLATANSAFGSNALENNTTGTYNTSSGAFALTNNTTGSQNTALGSNANVLSGNLSNATAIGARSRVDCDNCLVLGSVNGINGATSNVKVGIGTTNPNTSSALEINSIDKGLLIPRMSQTQRNAISTPATGLMIYQSDNTPGFYYHNGTSWTPVSSSTNNLWNLNGNAGTNASNFIGTTDNQSLTFKMNNELAGLISKADIHGGSNTSFGIRALNNNLTGADNTAFGRDALHFNNGNYNVAVGAVALPNNTTGYENTAMGLGTLMNNSTGFYNTALGSSALYYNVNGSNNIGIGFNATMFANNLNNTIIIGANATADCNNCMVLGSINGINEATSDVNVGIGTINPNANSVLDLTSTKRGFLLPRMTQAQRDAIVTPTVGLLIFQTNNTAGFYYHDGSAWTSVSSSTNNLWNLNGNGGTTSSDFIGTTDDQPLRFRVNNEKAGIIEGEATQNLFLGYKSGESNTATLNTAFGAFAMRKNAAGTANTAVGNLSLSENTAGNWNTAVGYNSLGQNQTGEGNIAIGSNSLGNNTAGLHNIAMGSAALLSNQSNYNTALGTNALRSNTNGQANIAIGFHSMYGNTNGSNNIALGTNTLENNQSNGNIAIGQRALFSNYVGYSNVALGHFALQSNIEGVNNSALGSEALNSNTTGGLNSTFGYQSMVGNTTGSSNTAIGSHSLSSNISGSGITSLGAGANVSNPDLNNATVIGSGATVNASNTVQIGNSAVTDIYFGNGTTTVLHGVVAGASNVWSLNGNTGTDPSNFIGTTDNQPLIFKANGQIAGRIDPYGLNGNTFIGGLAGMSHSNTSGSFNAAFGRGALFFNTSGSENTSIGSQSLYHNQGNGATSIGFESMGYIPNGEGSVAVGYRALRGQPNPANNTGLLNTAVGVNTLIDNTSGGNNTANGSHALYTNTTGSNNTALGSLALISNTTGSNNTAIGHGADVTVNNLTNATAIGFNAKVGSSNSIVLGGLGADAVNVGIGMSAPSAKLDVLGNIKIVDGTQGAGKVLTTVDGSGLATWQTPVASGWSLNGNTGTNPLTQFIGTTDNQPLIFKVNNNRVAKIEDGLYSNIFLGSMAGVNNTGYSNTGIGQDVLKLNTGPQNTATGIGALQNNSNGANNCANGAYALNYNTSGSSNTALGSYALTQATGSGNTAVGHQAFYNMLQGSNNTVIGSLADVTNGNLSNTTAIGYNAIVSASNTVKIGNTAVTDVYFGNPATTILHANSVTPSDARFKYAIEENVPGLDFIKKLKPVTYYLDEQKLTDYSQTGVLNTSVSTVYGKKQLHTGFLAQDVEKAASQLGFKFDGVHTPSNDKDYYSLSYSQFVMPLVKAVQEQQKQIEELKKENEELKKLKQQLEEISKLVQTLSARK